MSKLLQLTGEDAFQKVLNVRLTEYQMQKNGYPRDGDNPNSAKLYTFKVRPSKENRHCCARCNEEFEMYMNFDNTNQANNTCQHHPFGPRWDRRLRCGVHVCCGRKENSKTCTMCKFHVAPTTFVDNNNIAGFVKMGACDPAYKPTLQNDVFAVDCEMVFTNAGRELARVTVVDFTEAIVYDKLVSPTNYVYDYNTIHSGITESMLKDGAITLSEVHADLGKLFHSKTVLIGHSLESDLIALKIIHGVIIDTSVLYPHSRGPPFKKALRTLAEEHLQRKIQTGIKGHNSDEDAKACIGLLKHHFRG